MHTNNMFSTKRFILLFKQSVIVNKKLIGTSLIGAAGITFVALFVLQSMNNYQGWTNFSSMIFFLFCYVALGGIYISQSFPAFRSKEKSLVYLLHPASASEKFIFEFLTRIIALILFLPPIFWIIANIEGAIVHHYIPRFINYKFSFGEGLNQLITNKEMPGWYIFAVIQFFLFVYMVMFTGACHFSKSPRTKTLFTLSVIVGGYVLLGYLLSRGLNLKEYNMDSKNILFIQIRKKEEVFIFLSMIGIVVNLSLIAIAWFRFKEKEV
jgi:hypothetical protein